MSMSDLDGHKLQTLHEEHVAMTDQLELLMLSVRAARTSWHAARPQYCELLRTLLKDLEVKVEDHFRFEERYLFPRLREAGKPELADSLTLEHVAIRNAVTVLQGHLRDAQAEHLSEGQWTEFGKCAALLIELKRGHMQREESEMVPVLRRIVSEERGEPIT